MKALILTLTMTFAANAFATNSISCNSKSSEKKVEIEQGISGKVLTLIVTENAKTLASYKLNEIKIIGNSQQVLHAEKDIANSLTVVLGDEFRTGVRTSSLHLNAEGSSSIEELICTDESAGEE